MKRYNKKCDFHFSDDSLRGFIEVVQKLYPARDFDFGATVFVYKFSPDIPKLFEEPYSTVTDKFDRYEDFS